MKNIDLTPVIQALITLASTLFTVLILPKLSSFLKERLSKQQRENLRQWTEIAVRAAEQLYGSKTGQQKKDYVLAFLLEKGIVFDTAEVVALLESEVYKLTK